MSKVSQGKAKSDNELTVKRIHKSKELPDDLIRFSFRHFSTNDKFGFPETGVERYLPVLLDRLKCVSDYKVSDFRTNKSKSIRCHIHDWSRTTEPNGYSHLTSQLQECEPWQFCLSANEHGRIHGILIDEVFYVIWIDEKHKLYA